MSAFIVRKREAPELKRYGFGHIVGSNGKNRTTYRRNDKAIGRRNAGKHEGGGDGDVANHGIGVVGGGENATSLRRQAGG